ncbi:MAG: AAA family ATPase [Bacteroidales bacterium]
MKSPFKFLDSYTKDDREIFFGRDREIEELYHRIFESKIMLVYGVSGTGKSSLIHCGLANKFQETDWLPIVIRRGGNIIHSMAVAIKTASITVSQDKASQTVSKKDVLSLYLDYYKPVYFIFDQFEELFIFGDKEERRDFVHIVKSLIESDLQCRMIFVMREEYMAGITEFEKFIPTIFSNRVRIEKMSHRNALEAIKGPCKVFNINLEEGFAESLLEKLSPGSEDVELTYLQVFLDKIFKLASEDIKRDTNQLSFTLSQLQKTGDVSDLLGSFLDDQISLMDDPDLAMSVLKAFVSGKGTKRPASESETIDNVRSLGKEISPDKAKELIRAFVNLRVLRDRDDNGRYELRHDSLAEKVYEKFSKAEKELLEIRQMIETAYQYYLKRKILLNNDDLNYISNKDSFLNLNPELQGFLQESRKHQMEKTRTVKRLTGISALVFALLLGIMGYFVKGKIAGMNANNYVLKSLSQTKKPRERFQLARMAWESNQGLFSKEALLQAFYNIQVSADKDSSMLSWTEKYSLNFDPAPVNIQYAECSKDNKYVFGYADSLIFIWNINGNLEKIIETDHFPILDIKMSGDSWYIGGVSSDSLLTVWSITGNKMFSIKTRYNQLNTKQIFRFTQKNNILTLSVDHDAVLLDTRGSILQTFDRHKGSVNAVDISGDNKFFATASSDKTINVWYFNSLKKEYDYYNTLTWHKDTVWSVSFSNRNIDVLSASADSTVRVGTINNEDIYHVRFPRDQKYCYAEFTSSNRGRISICYGNKDKELNKTILASHGDNPTYNYLGIYGINNTLIHGLGGINFHHFAFSPDETFFIYLQNNETFLAENKLDFQSDRSTIYNLLELSGSKHFFTSDGKYILAIDGNKLKSYFVDVEDIYNLAK